jgi:transcriptional regulator with XRE-family HTH domain
MGAIADALRQDLRGKEFSEGYAEGFLDTYVSTQIKVLREQRGMTQAELANKIGTKQPVIARIERGGSSSRNIGTLKKLARAFNVRLHVSFETFGSLIGDFEKFSRASLARVERDNDPILYGKSARDDATASLRTINQASVQPLREFRALVGTYNGTQRFEFMRADLTLASTPKAGNSELSPPSQSSSGVQSQLQETA